MIFKDSGSLRKKIAFNQDRFMKRLLFFFLSILLTSCSSVGSIFSPIQSIKCKKIKSIEFSFHPFELRVNGKNGPIFFNKNTGELLEFDDFYETLTPLQGENANLIESTIVNGKLKINQKDKNRIWGRAIINLKDLNGKYFFKGTNMTNESEWDLKCVKVKNLSKK